MATTNLQYLIENDLEAMKDLLSCDEHECSECGFETYRREAGNFGCFTDKAVEWMMAIRAARPLRNQVQATHLAQATQSADDSQLVNDTQKHPGVSAPGTAQSVTAPRGCAEE